MKNFCYQGNDHDCGYASLKMLFAIISKNQNYLYLPKGSQSENFSFLDLIEIAASHQVHLAGYECNYQDLADKKFPILVEVTGNHLVVLTKIKKNYYYFNDPAKGKVKMWCDDFMKIYEGKCLVVENENLDRNYKVEKPVLMPKSFGIVHLVVTSLIVVMLGLDFYLMNLSENIPFIFLLMMFLVITEVFENWYLLKASAEFDEKYIPLYFRYGKHKNYEDYQKYLSIRSGIFSSSKSMVVFVALTLILGILMSINDLRNLLVIVIILLYKAIEKYATQFKDHELIDEISYKEKVVFDVEDAAIPNLIRLGKRANTYAQALSARNCFFQLVLMLLTLFMMIFTGNMSANFAVFHFGVYFVIGQGITLLLDRITNHQDHVKSLTQFFDTCGL